MNLQRAQDRMKKHADMKRKDVEFQIGTLVLVKLQPYRQHSLALRKNQKLSIRYFGPFEIIERVGKVAYKLKLPATAKIHAVFHVSQLKEFKGDNTIPYMPLPLTSSEVGPILLPKTILKSRVIQQGQKMIEQILVMWDDNDPNKATWEDLNDFKSSYPSFNLEDKIGFKGAGIVMKNDMASVESTTNGGALVNNVAADVAVRRSTRAKKENVMLREFVVNKRKTHQ